jgi:hypothetical protein
MLFRPGTADAGDPEFAEAMELARTHAELRAWFEQHCAFQTAMRSKFRQIEPPPELRAQLNDAQRLVRLRRRRRRAAAWMAAAAAAVLLLLALAVSLQGPRIPNRFADYRSRIVHGALRGYSMDIITKVMMEVRRFHADRGAPSDYALTKGLAKLTPTGAGLLKWRSNPVAMVCFDRGDHEMLFLFVLNKAALKDSPPGAPQVVPVNKLLTVSWTRGDYTYVLAGPEEPDFEKKYGEEEKPQR